MPLTHQTDPSSNADIALNKIVPSKKTKIDHSSKAEALAAEEYPAIPEVVEWLNGQVLPIYFNLSCCTGKGHHTTVASTVRKAREVGCTAPIVIRYYNMPLHRRGGNDLLESDKFEQVFGLSGITAAARVEIDDRAYGKLISDRRDLPQPPASLSIKFNYRQRPSSDAVIHAGMVPDGWRYKAWLASGDNKRLYKLEQGAYTEPKAEVGPDKPSANADLYAQLISCQASSQIAMQIVYGIHYSTVNAAHRINMLQKALATLYTQDDFKQPVVCVMPRKTEFWKIMSQLRCHTLPNGKKVPFEIITDKAAQQAYLEHIDEQPKQKITFFIVDNGFNHTEFQDLMAKSALPPVVEYNAYYECLKMHIPHLKSEGVLEASKIADEVEENVTSELYSEATQIMEAKHPACVSAADIETLSAFLYQCAKKEPSMMQLFERLGKIEDRKAHAFELLLEGIGKSFPDEIRPGTTLKPLNVDDTVGLCGHCSAVHDKQSASPSADGYQDLFNIASLLFGFGQSPVRNSAAGPAAAEPKTSQQTGIRFTRLT